MGVGVDSCEVFGDLRRILEEMGNAKAGRGGFLVLIHANFAVFLSAVRAYLEALEDIGGNRIGKC